MLADDLRFNLAGLDASGLRRKLRPVPAVGPRVTLDGAELLHCASNDYLGLATHPALRQAAVEATEQYGTGAGASRLVTGTLPIHQEAETAFAAFKHAEAALLMPTGFMANLAVLTALAGEDDLIVQDKLNHASLIDAAKFSGACVRTFPHLGYGKAERLLAESDGFRRKFLVTDSVFSMDGDTADLRRCADLCQQYGAILVVDEAHGSGVLGASGAGLIEESGLTDHPAVMAGVVVSTASKALGGLGGMVSASKAVIDTLVNGGRPFVYTTAVPPAQAATLLAALRVVRDEPQRRTRLRALGARVRQELAALGWELPPACVQTPIIPLLAGSAEAALSLAGRLHERGILAVAVRPPTVPPNSARVRITLRSDFSDAEVTRLIEAIGPKGPLQKSSQASGRTSA